MVKGPAAIRPKIGFALGSGAARGWAHIGIIEALAEMGIVPDIVSGTSIGALVGAAYATGQLERLHQRMDTFRRQDVMPLLDVNITAGGLIEGGRIEAFLTGLGITGQIEASPIVFAAVATELTGGSEIWIRSGPIERAVRASISIPGIFSPVPIDNDWTLDGGLVNPVPVSLCRALGADIIIAVDLNGELLGRRFPLQAAVEEPKPKPGQDWLSAALTQLPAPLAAQLAPLAARKPDRGPAPPGYFDVLTNSLNIMQDHITRTRLAGEPPHVLLRPNLGRIDWMDFHRAKESIAEGRDCVQRAEPALRRYFPAAS